MKKKCSKITLTKSTITKLNTDVQQGIKGGITDTFLDCFTRGLCTSGTGVLCY